MCHIGGVDMPHQPTRKKVKYTQKNQF